MSVKETLHDILHHAFKDWKNIAITLVLIIVVLLFVVSISKIIGGCGKKEGVQFKVTGHKNKRACQNYHLELYWDCVKNNGGVDGNGYCWSVAEPNLVGCNRDYF